jgi:hypothetical protein
MRPRAPALVVLLSAWLAAPGHPAAAPGTLPVVFPPVAGQGVRTGQLTALRKALQKPGAAARPLRGKKHHLTAACAAEPGCVARRSAAAKARYAIVVVVSMRRRQLEAAVSVVAVADKRELHRRELRARSSQTLARSVKSELAEIMAAARQAEAAPGPAEPPPAAETPGAAPAGDRQPAAAPAAPKALAVSVPPRVVGDGRSVVPIVISGGPGPRDSERPDHPELPAVDCEGALSLPALAKQPPRILPPPVREPRTVACNVTWRDATATFDLHIEPPRQPGLYIGTNLTRVRTDIKTNRVPLEAFAVDDSGAILPGQISSVVASSGKVFAEADGTLTLHLPDSRSPRVIAVLASNGRDVGTGTVPVWGVTKLDVTSERGATVKLRIAGRWSGSRRAPRGRARLPIEVPPGVGHAVVRGERRGVAVESVVNLRVPSKRRIAAMSLADPIAAGGRTPIFVAVSAADGQPAPPSAAVTAQAKRGTVARAQSLGNGLWEVPYRAPATPSRDEVTVFVKGQRSAGRMTVSFDVVPGAPQIIHVALPDRPFGPGDKLMGAAFVRDAEGNLLDSVPLRVTLDGNPLETQPRVAGTGFSTRVPERLPDSRRLHLVVNAGTARIERNIAVHPELPASAVLSLRASGRRARATIEVRDRFSNLIDPSGFDVLVSGARLGPLERGGDRYRANLAALDDSRDAVVEIRAGGGTLAQKQVTFGPPRNAFVLGAYGEAGWVASGGAVSAPRAGAGFALRRYLGPVELALGAGAEGFVYEDQSEAMIAGLPRTVGRSLTGIAVPVQLRARLAITERTGVSVAAAAVPTRVGVQLQPDFQAEDRYTEVVVGGRSQVALDWHIGAARARFALSYGSARLTDSLVTGKLEGLGIAAGVEWWFWDLSH